MSPKLEDVIARTVAELRKDRDWTQADLARHMVAMGFKWQPNRVAQLETLRHPPSLFESIALCWVFELPLVDLMPGEESVVRPDGGEVPLAHVRAAIAGDVSVQDGSRKLLEKTKASAEELRKAARRAGVDSAVLNHISVELYGKGFMDEREERAGDLSDLPKRSAQTKRGHATRGMLAEIREYIEREGIEEIERRHRERQAERLEQLRGRLQPPELDMNDPLPEGSHLTVRQDMAGKWRIALIGSDHKVHGLSPEGYLTKADALKTIDPEKYAFVGDDAWSAATEESGAKSLAETLRESVEDTQSRRARLRDEVARRYRDGEGVRALALSTGRSYGFIHRLLTEAGIEHHGVRDRSRS